jgi:3-hydroxyisobutyrate dehydrogenase-like beta-hydroxyacid dehydrogenase
LGRKIIALLYGLPGNYTDAAILAREPKARRMGHLKVVVTGDSDKCEHNWPLCAPNGKEKRSYCGGE